MATNPRRSNGSRRDKVVARVKREEDTCWLCHEPVDKTLPAGLPESPEIDEIIPVSLGGDPYDRKNCRLAHRLCNQRRGNKPPQGPRKPVTLATSRQW
jgi:5-methylcytosine-specific restriction endonuclease McrA